MNVDYCKYLAVCYDFDYNEINNNLYVLMSEKKSLNPLKTVWNVISTVSGAIGLVSFADSWYKWDEVFVQILEAYRGIVYWPFKIIPFKIPWLIKDYLFFGFLFWSSTQKGLNYVPGNKKEYKLKFRETFLNFVEMSALHILLIVFWPGVLIYVFREYYNEQKDAYKEVDQTLKITLLWFAAVLLLFFAFLIISVIMKD